MEESAALTEAKASSQPEWAQLTRLRSSHIGSRRTSSQQTAADETVGRTRLVEVGAVGNRENLRMRPGIKKIQCSEPLRGPESRIKKITR